MPARRASLRNKSLSRAFRKRRKKEETGASGSGMPARRVRPHEIKFAELSSESEEKKKPGRRGAGMPARRVRPHGIQSLCQAFFRKRVESGRTMRTAEWKD